MANLTDWDWEQMVVERDWDAMLRAASQAGGAKIDPFKERHGEITLLMAAAASDWGKGCELMAPLSEVDAMDEDGDTALMIAMKCAAPSAALALVPFCDPSKLDVDGDAPVHVAIREGFHELALALAKRCPASIAGHDGLAPIFLALRQEDEDLAIAMARQAGPAALDLRNLRGDSALIYSLQMELERASLCLIELSNPARCSDMDSRGFCAYLLALEAGMDDAASALAGKCDPDALDADGDDALDCALLYGRWDQAKGMAARVNEKRSERFQGQLAKARTLRSWFSRALGF